MYQVGNLVKELSDKHGHARESLMPILQAIVQKHNYLTDEAMVEVARELDISAAEVYGTASSHACRPARSPAPADGSGRSRA